MVRYVKQRTNATCGPVGVINAFKWLGYPVSANNDLKKLVEVCGTNCDGTRGPGIQNGLDFLEQAYEAEVGHFTFRRSFNIKSIESNLKKGNAILLIWMGHVWFLSNMSQSGKSIYVVNAPSKRLTVKRLSLKWFRRFWKTFHGRSWGWIVSKKPFSEWLQLELIAQSVRYTK